MEHARPAGTGRVRRASFRIATGVTGAFLLVALSGTYPLLFTNWLPADAWLAVRPDRASGDQVHRLHSMALAVISWGALLGVVLQFHRPGRKLGALLMSLAAMVAVACGLGLTGSFDVAGMAPFLLLPLLTLEPVWATATLAWCIGFGIAAWVRSRPAPEAGTPVTGGAA